MTIENMTDAETGKKIRLWSCIEIKKQMSKEFRMVYVNVETCDALMKCGKFEGDANYVIYRAALGKRDEKIIPADRARIIEVSSEMIKKYLPKCFEILNNGKNYEK